MIVILIAKLLKWGQQQQNKEKKSKNQSHRSLEVSSKLILKTQIEIWGLKSTISKVKKKNQEDPKTDLNKQN